MNSYLVLIPGAADPRAPLIVHASSIKDAKRHAVRDVLGLAFMPPGVVALRIASSVPA